ncbi:hypothetical protein D3C81_2263720 [compost metagenome]
MAQYVFGADTDDAHFDSFRFLGLRIGHSQLPPVGWNLQRDNFTGRNGTGRIEINR